MARQTTSTVYFSCEPLAEYQRRNSEALQGIHDISWYLLQVHMSVRNVKTIRDPVTLEYHMNLSHDEGFNVNEVYQSLELLSSVNARLQAVLYNEEDDIFTKQRLLQARLLAVQNEEEDYALLERIVNLSTTIWTEVGLDNNCMLPVFWQKFVTSSCFWRGFLKSSGVDPEMDMNLSEETYNSDSDSQFSSHSQDLNSTADVWKILNSSSSSE